MDLRSLVTGENVDCHGVLWLLDRMERSRRAVPAGLHDGLTTLAGHRRCDCRGVRSR
jgi:hypothetical protein